MIWGGKVKSVLQKLQVVYREMITQVLSLLPPNWTARPVSLPTVTREEDGCFAMIPDVSGELPTDVNQKTIRGPAWGERHVQRWAPPSSLSMQENGPSRAVGEQERQITPLHPPPLSRISGSRPQRTPSPLNGLGPATPRVGRQRAPPPAAAAPPPGQLSPQPARPRPPREQQAIDSAACRQEPRESKAYTARPEPRPGFHHFPHTGGGARGQPSPGGRAGGAETTCNCNGGEPGYPRPASANKSPGVAHPPPSASQVAHSSSGQCSLASRALRTLETIIKARRGSGHHSTKGDGAGPLRAPGAGGGRQPPARLLPPLRSPSRPQVADPDPSGGQPCHRPAPGPTARSSGRRRQGLEFSFACGSTRPPSPPNPKNAPCTF